LLSAAAVRERSRNIADAVIAGQSRHFRVDRARLDEAASLVARVTRERYPDLAIPYHSRWRHIEAGGVDRRALLPDDPHAHVDLTVVSVLLDAGSGPGWSYFEEATGKRFTRSEGLGVASFRAFADGAFSAGADPFRVDAERLADIDEATLGALFEVRDDNPLVGLGGRAALLRRLGEALDGARPSGLYGRLTAQSRSVSVTAILRELLDMLGPIWLTGSTLDGIALGDAWQHPHASGDGPTRGWVPFHKLSQWLTYSLLEPLAEGGITVTDLDSLTGLPEYRNGGLLVDGGLLVPKDARLLTDAFAPGAEPIVEWRALTVALLDEVAKRVRERLGMTAEQLPLAKVLQGGTWSAGRRIAAEKRVGGTPPIRIESDGTVF
jgi:hypothetical protein